MTSDELLIDRIRAVNPIPNDDESVLSTAALLAAVDEGSGAMRTGPVEGPPPRRPWTSSRNGLLVAAAAFVIVLAVAGVAMLTVSTQPDVIDTPTTTSLPPTTTSVPPTTTLDPEAAWAAIPSALDESAGLLRTTTFAAPFSFDTGGAEFGAAFEREDWLALRGPVLQEFGVDAVVVMDTIEDTILAFEAIHGLYPEAQMTDPVPATLGGAEGVMFETTGLPFPLPEDADHPFIMADPSGRWTVGAGGGEVFIVDVDGQIVVVGYGATDFCMGCPSASSPAQLEAARNQARALIDSIVWKDLR